MVPYCKTGGLADVLGALPVELARSGANVVSVVPYYRQVMDWVEKNNVELEIPPGSLEFFLPGYSGGASIRKLVDPSGMTVLFIDYPSAFDRDELYTESGRDYEDNNLRFSVFSKAALEAAKLFDFKPDIVHAHDWQASMAVVYLKTHYRSDKFFADTKSVLTIHNLGYQGRFPAEKFPSLDLPWDYFTPDGLEYFGQVNYLKGGILYADQVTTVSPTYAKEIQTREFGAGLEGVLKTRANNLTGILNGVDYEAWNPESDKLIPTNFSVDDLDGKIECRRVMLKEMGLPANAEGPVIGMVTRLAEQKGLDIIASSIKDIAKLNCSLVILGTGDPVYHDLLEKAAKKYPENVAVKLTFSNELAHLIEAGSDIFAMPSKYEPCGLNQMYSLKYGTVPLVSKTGGLKDTIVNATTTTVKNGKATGFVMNSISPRSFVTALKKAVEMYRANPDDWTSLMLNGMKKDFSWNTQATAYMSMYKKLSSEVEAATSAK